MAAMPTAIPTTPPAGVNHRAVTPHAPISTGIAISNSIMDAVILGHAVQRCTSCEEQGLRVHSLAL